MVKVLGLCGGQNGTFSPLGWPKDWVVLAHIFFLHHPLPVLYDFFLVLCLFSPLSLLFMFLAYLWHAWCLSHVEAIMVQVSQRYGNAAVRAQSCVTATPISESLPRPFGSICRRMDIASTQGVAHLSASHSIAAAKL